MTGSDEIRNTGVFETQTFEEREEKDFSHRDHRGYREEEKESTIIEGDVSAGIGAGDGASAKSAQENKSEQHPVPRKPNLSPEQQEWLNKVFIPNFRRELIKNLKTADMRPNERKGKDNVIPRDSTGDKSLEHVLADKEKAIADVRDSAEKEQNRLMGIISEVKIDRELVASASRQNSVNPSQVAQLLRGCIRLNDEMAPVVLDDDGEAAVNGEGRLMTIDERVKGFLAENPHFVKPMGPFGGSGASDSLSGQMHIAAATGGDLIGAALREEKRQHGYARR